MIMMKCVRVSALFFIMPYLSMSLFKQQWARKNEGNAIVFRTEFHQTLSGWVIVETWRRLHNLTPNHHNPGGAV